METAVNLWCSRYTHQGCRWHEVCPKISLIQRNIHLPQKVVKNTDVLRTPLEVIAAGLGVAGDSSRYTVFQKHWFTYGEVNISHENTAMVVWIYDGV